VLDVKLSFLDCEFQGETIEFKTIIKMKNTIRKGKQLKEKFKELSIYK